MKVAKFVGAPDDPALFEKVVWASDIDVMREKAKKISAKKPDSFGRGSATHFNKGVSGTWKAKLTVAQGELLTEHCEEKLRTLDVSNPPVDLSFDP